MSAMESRPLLGLVWIAGRILYMTGYSQAANKRGTGFGIQAAAAGMLWLGALGAIVWRLVHAMITRDSHPNSKAE